MVLVRIHTRSPLIIKSGQQYYTNELVCLSGRGYARLNIASFGGRVFQDLSRELVSGDLNPEDIPSRLRGAYSGKRIEKDKILYRLECLVPLDPDEKYSLVEEIIKDVDGVPYIPGSSVKGLFRVALLKRFAEKNPGMLDLNGLKNTLKKYEWKLRSTYRLNRDEIKAINKEVSKRSVLLDKQLKIGVHGVGGSGRDDTSRDFFSLLEFSDFHPVKDEEVGIVLVRPVLSKGFSRRGSGLHYSEACTGVFSGSIVLADGARRIIERMDGTALNRVLELLGLSDRGINEEELVSSLLEVVDEYTRSAYDAGGMDAFYGVLGSWTGLSSKTVVEAVRDYDRELYDLLVLFVKKSVTKGARPVPRLGKRMVLTDSGNERPGLVSFSLV